MFKASKKLPHSPAASIIKRFDMIPLTPEGGYFKEMYRSKDIVDSEIHGQRNALTSIYFLLESNDFSAWHTTAVDEAWYFHQGSNLLIHTVGDDGKLSSIELGLENPGEPQFTVPANKLVCAIPKDPDSFTFLSTAVGPGFELRDFKLAQRDDLLARFPQHHDLILRFTREVPQPAMGMKL